MVSMCIGHCVGVNMHSVDFTALMKPRAFLVSDTEQGAGEAKRALDACACDCSDHVGLHEAALRLLSAPQPDIVIINVGADDRSNGASLVALADTASDLNCPMVIAAPLPVIDTLPMAVWSATDALLVDPTDIDFAAAISVAMGKPRHQLHDVSRDLEAARLQRLADEVGRIARTLATLSVEAPLPGERVGDMRPSFLAEPALPEAEPSATEIRSVIRMRRLRDRFFERDLFADPAWDMLLDLMAARVERVQVAVSSLCIAACVPPTTALRWIKAMTDSGLFDRIADPDDGRRIFIKLSDKAAANMTRYFAALRSANEVAI